MFGRLAVYFVVCLALQAEVQVGAKSFNPDRNVDCGYKTCNKARPDALNVHLVPHSHDDVGWLKTVDQYFYGTKTIIQRADVKAIITSVVAALQENSERRFIQVETAFFYQWWHQQNEQTKKIVYELVQSGQLEFAGGAWSMNDEGVVHYQSIVDQFSFGLKFLNETFGECGRPKVGWQIDPFGHSSEMASIFAQMGFDGLFFARTDWRDKIHRLNTKSAEMIWQGCTHLGNDSNIFTSLLYNHYSAPPGFCFDVLCHEDPIVKDENSTEYNFRVKIDDFTNFVKKQANLYKTNNVIITMGDDFNYQDAIAYYRNMDTLIEGFKVWPQKDNGRNINVFYSTPACYVKAVNDAVNSEKIELPLETHDFFPYASDPHAYWSGYFSSRPASKRSEKSANNVLQIHKQLAVFAQANGNDEFFDMQKSVGIMQHHDAITGTEKQHVADDYARIMGKAFADSEAKINTLISKLLSKDDNNGQTLNLKQCLMKNATICVEANSDKYTVVVYNPLAIKTKYPVRLPVNTLSFAITGPNGENVLYQAGDNIAFESHVKHGNKYEITFIVKMDPLGLKVFHVKKTSKSEYVIKEDYSRRRLKLGNDNTGFTLDPSTGFLDTVKINGNELKLRQELMYYLSAAGDNSVFEKRASGAYIFRPVNGTQACKFAHKVENISVFHGDIYDEVHQVFSDWARQSIRVYHDQEVADNIEFEWFVGSIPVGDNIGKEVISRFTSNINSLNDFNTDSNGREMLHRIRNYRPNYNYTNEEPVAGNYYPVSTQITISDGNLRISVLNDRSQGGSSLESGQIELMVHRRMLRDDAFGVGEALNEMEDGEGIKVRGRHYLTLTTKETQSVERRLANRISLEPWIFIDDTTDFETNFKSEFSGLNSGKTLHSFVKLLTLEPLSGVKNTLLIRLENFNDWDTKSEITVNLAHLFNGFEIVALEETTLAGTESKSTMKRLTWDQFPSKQNTAIDKKNRLEVTLKTFEIRTFIARVIYQ